MPEAYPGSEPEVNASGIVAGRTHGCATRVSGHMDVRDRLASLAAERIVILDGAWGVLLQGRGLSEEDFRGERFRDPTPATSRATPTS